MLPRRGLVQPGQQVVVQVTFHPSQVSSAEGRRNYRCTLRVEWAAAARWRAQQGLPERTFAITLALQRAPDT